MPLWPDKTPLTRVFTTQRKLLLVSYTLAVVTDIPAWLITS